MTDVTAHRAEAAGGHVGRTDTSHPRFLIAAGNFFFRRRNALFPIVFLALLLPVLGGPRPFLGSIATDAWLDAAGILVILAGQALRVAVIGLAYIHRGGRDGRPYASDLVVEGLFAHSRNPLYLGNLLVYGGLLMVLNSIAGWLIGAPFFLFAYLAITFAEEDFLERKFGPDYADYRRRVPRLLPRLAGLGATMRSMRFRWRRVLRKEYGSTFAWITTLLVLLGWERVWWLGWDGAVGSLRVLAVVWLCAAVGYGVVRYLKKTHRLDEA